MEKIMEKMMIAFLVICGAWILWDLYESYRAWRMNHACQDDEEINGV